MLPHEQTIRPAKGTTAEFQALVDRLGPLAGLVAPLSAARLAELETALGEVAGWSMATVEGATPFLEEVTAAGADVAEIVAVDADPPVALLGVAVIVFVFGAGLFINATGSVLTHLPGFLGKAGRFLTNLGHRVVSYGVDVAEWMVRPLVQLATALWRGLDKLFSLGLATAASLGLAIYKHIHVIGPAQIAANDIKAAHAAARQINSIIAVAPDYEMKAVKAGHDAVSRLMRSLPKTIPVTTAAAVGVLATVAQANTTIVDECALPWCDTLHTAKEIENALASLLKGLFGAALFCEAVTNPAGVARAVSGDAAGFLAGLGAACVAAGDPFGGAALELTAAAVADPGRAAEILTSAVCG